MSGMSDSARNTLDYYNRAADEYRERIKDSSTPYLNEFTSLLNKGQRVLDLGCGPGHCAREMAEAGLIVDAVDGAAEMVELAAQIENVSAQEMLFSELAAQDTYDAVWANFSLLHAPKSEFPDCLSRIHKALKPGGLFHIGMKLDQQDGTDVLGRHYSYYSLDELRDHLIETGFAIFDQHLGSGKGMAGIDEPWVVIWSRKEKNND